ncbi:MULTISPECIES: NAD(+) diphosphatase [unclassified Psychrobacter]|uniref:NAD(+) diphosphatase n=2 Tax=Psychrobacter TaxID=497 RepID=UPI003FD322F5
MTCAFILNDDTILCQQTPDGMRPLSVALPHLEDANSSEAPKYQLGRVQLFESVAPHHRLPKHYSAVRSDDVSDSTTSYMVAYENAAETIAISYDYALAHNIKLPLTDTTAFVAYRQLITELPAALCDQLSQAMQLLRWQADTQFCSRCAAPVILAAQNDRSMVCPICNLRQYPRVQPCVITAITRPNPSTGETQILLAHHHRYGTLKLPLQYGLIAGFVEVGESLEHAVVREVGEEVGITLKDIAYVSSQPWPYPSNLMLGFRASYVGGDIVLQEDELSHADFFDLSNLPKIPAKGSIAYNLIAQIAHEEGVSL